MTRNVLAYHFFSDGTAQKREDAAPLQASETDALADVVATGDVQKTRSFIENGFWQNKPVRPAWKHLLAALKTGKRDMVRLLAAYDARPGADDLEKLKTQAGDEYPQYIRLLRQAGLPMSLAAFESHAQSVEAGINRRTQAEKARREEEKEAAEKAAREERAAAATRQSLLEKIPQEWLGVLASMQQTGAPEAVIAGGALRDLFNGRKVKDVDIFLTNRGSERKNRKFLTRAFKAAQIRVAEQPVSTGYYGSTRREAFPVPKMQKFSRALDEGRRLVLQSAGESWTVLAGPDKTEYNVVFVSENLMNAARGADGQTIAAGRLLNAFDFGLCQISTDGKKLCTTAAYDGDVANKRISLVQGNDSSKEHLHRIMKKYADWTLNDGAKKLLEKPRLAAPGGYGRLRPSTPPRGGYGRLRSFY
jgi:hypothetical protein